MDPEEHDVVLSPYNDLRISIISTVRRKRPDLHGSKGECPFCPGRENLTPRTILALTRNNGRNVFIRSSRVPKGRWITRVFPNMYPALIPKPSPKHFSNKPSVYGYHEVLVESTLHDEDKYLLEWRNIYYALLTLRERAREIMHDNNIQSFVAIKNSGAGCGASIPHPHIQLFAFSFIPPMIKAEVDAFRKASICPLCELKSHGELLIDEGKHMVLSASPAPTSSYETVLYPKRHEPSFTEASEDELAELSIMMRDALLAARSIGKCYNWWLHTAPRSTVEFHWHIGILPKTAEWGGLEKGSGVYLVTVGPREAAETISRIIRSLENT